MEKRLLIFLVFLFSILILRLFVFYSTKPNYKDNQAISISTILLQEAKTSYDYQTFSILDDSGHRIFIKTTMSPGYYYGDNLKISGNINIKLLNKSQILIMNYPEISLDVGNKNPFLAVVGAIRQSLIDFFHDSLPRNSSSLMLGIVFGIKQDFSNNFLNSLKAVGVMHVIAASGMNVTLVGGFVFYMFSYFLKRQRAIFLSVLVILFYAFLAGFQASIIRASIMAIIAFSAESLGKQRYSQYALFLTGFIMLIIWPQFLEDIGFQLSFMATLGILIIPSYISLGKNSFLGDLLTTVSAQVATFPIIVSNFGIYSLWSVIVNVLVLWTVPILMILGGISAIISFVYAPLAVVILYLCIPLLAYFEKIVTVFSGFNGEFIIQNFPWQFSVAYYLFLLSLVIFFTQKRIKKM